MSKGKKKDQDLTRIENLSEFNHEDDTEIDRLFESFNTQKKKSSSSNQHHENAEDDSYNEEEGSRIYNLDELEDSTPNEEEGEESSNHFESSEDHQADFQESYAEDDSENSSENSLENDNYDYQSTEANAFELSSDSDFSNNSLEDQSESDSEYNSEMSETSETLDSNTNWETPAFESDESSAEEISEKISEEISSFSELESEFPPPLPEEIEIPENDEESNEADHYNDSGDDSHEAIFQAETSNEVSKHYSDVNHFGNNITPSEHLSQVANPPYSIAIENIQFEEDARELKKILEEFEIISPANENDYQLAIKNGRVLVPQVSEYKAIMLGHALRKFNFSIQVGLSHQIFPQSSAAEDFKGLISKKFAHQNLREDAKKREPTFEIEDIQMTSLSDIPDFSIEQLHDVKTIMSVISKDELERLLFVESALRDDGYSNFIDHEASLAQNQLDDSEENETLKAYQSYQKSFEHLFDEMTNRLREDAYTQGHNAVIGVNFQINPIINQHDNQISSYTITCSATFATVTKRP